MSSPRTEAMKDFLESLSGDDIALIAKFVELRSDYLDEIRGLKPWDKGDRDVKHI